MPTSSFRSNRALRRLRLYLNVEDQLFACRLSEDDRTLAESSTPWNTPNADRSPLALASLIGEPTLNSLEDAATAAPFVLEIDIRAKELEAAPWETLALERPIVGSLALNPRISTMRFVEKAKRHGRPFKRVLIVCANPGTPEYPFLASAESELASVTQAFQCAECRQVDVEVLRYATSDALKKALTDRPPDVLHFIGHGARLPSGAALVMEGGKGGHDLLYTEELASTLVKSGTEYVVLNACHSAAPDGLCRALAEFGIGAVVGMRNPLDDDAGPPFARAFYASLAEGRSIEEAVAEGRRAIRGMGDIWASPVLYAGSFVDGQVAVPSWVASTKLATDDEKSFVGRRTELAKLQRLLVKDCLRHVTITGMGGMGKTRIARKLANELAPTFNQCVWFVDCDSVESEQELLAAIASEMRLEGRPDVEAIAESLGDLSALLVLDCFERIIGAAGLVDRLVRATPKLQVLVTSRVLLNSESEIEFVLEPFSAGSADGTRLFGGAGARARTGFRVDKQNRPLVRSIVDELDGVPLAILLAAGRLRHISLEELQTQIRTRRLDILRRRSQGQDKHADMLRVVDDSFNLLDESLRELLIALSVFRGGFRLEDAMVVLDGIADLLDGISELRDNSLLIVSHQGEQTRYRILDTVREFLVLTSAGRDLDLFRGRQLDLFRERAGQIGALQAKGKWAEATKLLWDDSGNFHVAVDFALSKGDEASIRQFSKTLCRTYFEAGMRREFSELSDAGLTAAENAGDVDTVLGLLGLVGQRARREGDRATARSIWQRRADLAEQQGAIEIMADAWLDLVDVASLDGDLVFVDRALEKLRSIEADIGPAALRASCILVEAKRALSAGVFEDALKAAERAEGIIERADPAPASLYIWMSLAETYRQAGDLDRSERMAKRMIVDALSLGLHQSMGRGLLELASTWEQKGQLPYAALALATCAAIPRSVSARLRDLAVESLNAFRSRNGKDSIAEAEAQAKATNAITLAAELSSLKLSYKIEAIPPKGL